MKNLGVNILNTNQTHRTASIANFPYGCRTGRICDKSNIIKFLIKAISSYGIFSLMVLTMASAAFTTAAARAVQVRYAFTIED
jgi:hypothetical protein